MAEPINLTTFSGMIPRLPPHQLPENAAQNAVNVDFAHGQVRGLLGATPTQTGLTITLKTVSVPAATSVQSAIASVYTEDGANFFAWPYETSVVKSMVPNDTHNRIYYSAVRPDGPVLKVARTADSDSTAGVTLPVIGTARVGGNFQPPENSSKYPIAYGYDDSWLLGVPAPIVSGIANDFASSPTLALTDKAAWPGSPTLQLKVTFFVEDATGKIVYTQDISNYETTTAQPTWLNVFWTNDASQRGNKVQDTLYALYHTQAPYKNYFFSPPDVSKLAVGRTVTVQNTDPALNIVITYNGAPTVDPNPGGGTGGGGFDGGGA